MQMTSGVTGDRAESKWDKPPSSDTSRRNRTSQWLTFPRSRTRAALALTTEQAAGLLSGGQVRDLGEVDLGGSDVVHEVGQQELRREGDDLHDLPVGVARVLHILEIVVADASAGLDHATRERRCGLA